MAPEFFVHLEPDTLTDIEYLCGSFFDRAAAAGYVPPNRDGRLLVLATAAEALMKGRNPGALFWRILKAPAGKRLRMIGQRARRTAVQKLDQYEARPVGSRVLPKPLLSATA